MKKKMLQPAEWINRLFHEVWNQGQIDLIPHLFASDFVLHAGDAFLTGGHTFQNVVKDWLTGFPDLQHRVEQVIFQKHLSIVRWSGQGTHLGVFQGQVATKRKVSYSGITIFKIKDGVCTEAWVSADTSQIQKNIRQFSTKVYTENDFCEDFTGPAQRIYEWLMKARPLPSGKQQIANALREMYNQVPVDGLPPLVIPDELMSKIQKQEIFIPGVSGPIRCLLFRPSSKKPLPILIYMHGGGWFSGDPEESELVTRKLALKAGIAVISVDYRLAPEYPFPCGLDDCFSVYEWLRAKAENLNLDGTRIATAGDSAGGNLALAIALRGRNETTLPQGVVAICPGTDFVMDKYPSVHRFGYHGLLYDYAFYNFARSAYVTYDKWTHPYASPMYDNFERFCPTCVIAAGQDLLIDENKIFAEKLAKAGQDVELHIYDEMPHAFYYFLGLTTAEENCYQVMAQFLKRILY